MNIKQSFKRNFRWLVLISGLLTVIFTSLALFNHVLAQDNRATPIAENDEHIISIYDRGEERIIITKARSIRQALKSAEVDINIGWDVVEPGLDTELVAAKYNVNIFRARPVTVVDGEKRKRVTTAQQTPELIAKAANITLHKEDEIDFSISTDVLLDSVDTVMQIDRATPVVFNLFGKRSEIRSQAETVGDLLKERDITLGENDILSLPTETRLSPGLEIELWRDGKQTVTQEEEINFTIDQIQDVNRAVGYKEVKVPGEKGTKNVTYEIEMKNGEEVSRTEIASVITKEPKKQQEVVGTKNNYSGSLNEWLLALRQCETGGRYNASTGNGYYGAYQFLPSTWNSIAKRAGREDLVGVMPHQAAPADQDAMVIANTNATAGLSTQHPGCYKKLGLSNKPPA